MLGVDDLLRARQIAVRDGIAQRGEGVHALGQQVAVGMVEDGLRGLGQLAAEGDGHVAGDGLRGRAGDGEQVGQFGQGGFGGHVEAGDDASAREAHAGGVEGVDAAREAW